MKKEAEIEKKRVTLRDVAVAAGVSVATASIVLNGISGENQATQTRRRVSEKTEQKVREVARQLHYLPDINAQTLKGRSSSTIGLIIPDLSNHFYPELAKGIARRATQLGYNVMLFDSDENYKNEIASIDTLRAAKVAGIIVSGVYEQEQGEYELLKSIQADKLPIVQVDRYASIGNIPYVGIDNYRAAYEMVEHLAELGHKKIGFIGMEQSLHTLNERKRGYRHAMKDLGLEIDENIMFFVDDTSHDNAVKVVDEFMKYIGEVSALFVARSDVFAIECMQEFLKRGVKIPEELSLTGFDGIYMGDYMTPKLSTVYQPKFAMGEAAVDMLCSIIGGRQAHQNSIILNYEVLMKDSVKKMG